MELKDFTNWKNLKSINLIYASAEVYTVVHLCSSKDVTIFLLFLFRGWCWAWLSKCPLSLAAASRDGWADLHKVLGWGPSGPEVPIPTRVAARCHFRSKGVAIGLLVKGKDGPLSSIIGCSQETGLNRSRSMVGCWQETRLDCCLSMVVEVVLLESCVDWRRTCPASSVVVFIADVFIPGADGSWRGGCSPSPSSPSSEEDAERNCYLQLHLRVLWGICLSLTLCICVRVCSGALAQRHLLEVVCVYCAYMVCVCMCCRAHLSSVIRRCIHSGCFQLWCCWVLKKWLLTISFLFLLRGRSWAWLFTITMCSCAWWLLWWMRLFVVCKIVCVHMHKCMCM